MNNEKEQKMREIKFRAWDNANKEMHHEFQWMNIDSEGESIIFNSREEPFEHDLLNPHYTKQFNIMEYTGLQDKNDVDIYEGDVFDLQGKRLVIEYHCGRFLALTGHGFDIPNCYEVGEDFVYENELIGNIHENPELLERK